ncbi:N-acetylneuraminate synthase family protein [bacterium]|nr:N-acetylneuraminate synthase family protein [candidate division CSSED10-310 bacterium]
MLGASVKIADQQIGFGNPCFVVAEIGINHNGDVETALRLIDAAISAGCQAVKFQKRDVDLVYSREDLGRLRESPFGSTNGDLKRGLEFGENEYTVIDNYCRQKGILWFASCWDEKSVAFLESFGTPCFKISSACLTHDDLLLRCRDTGRPLILSTGMSTLEQVRHAVRLLGTHNLIILHTTSTYPTKVEDLNLRVIQTLQNEFPCPIGYSGHEVGLQTSLAAVVLGACMIERHLTLDRAMWGSDQAASVEPHGLARLVRDIRSVELALGDGIKRIVPDEIPVMQKLRRTPEKPSNQH